MLERLGPYRILRKLGEGGMGVVYAAQDERLGREVALKLASGAGGEQALKRFRREARLAASVNHPNVCLLHEIGEDGGRPFLVMELLQGESLSERLRRGPLPVVEAVRVGLAVLAALTALHEGGIVHRDLKPSNVFLSTHGVKLLDFGLARPEAPDGGRTRTELTQAGVVVGTPHYMAPEQVRDGRADARSDLFAVGALLFEMLSGRRAFGGAGVVEVFHATLYEQPPMLTGSPAIARVDTVVRRALAKSPEERFSSAAEMARELEACLELEVGSAPVVPRALTRLIVLPFRILRADAETDFLAVSLPDAITTTLSGLQSLVVRSSLSAARFAAEPDLARVAAEAQVDAVLAGTLLRSGEQVRVSTQLVEAPGGAVLWSHVAQVTLGEIFGLQDALVQRIVEGLALPLTAREQRSLRRDVPATAKAYEFYLRGHALSLQSDGWDVARQLYEQCLGEDPVYAPGWASLGRVSFLLAKYGHAGPTPDVSRAESALQRALDLNPELALAHRVYAQLEVEKGRPLEALRRLLALAATRGQDAELFGGLCHVLRYGGLLEASLAAHERARRIDPGIRTSVGYTCLALGDYAKGVALEQAERGFLEGFALTLAGRDAEALAHYASLVRSEVGPRGIAAHAMRAALAGEREAARQGVAELERSPFRDPEGFYYIGRLLARAGDTAGALRFLRRAVEGGFTVPPLFEHDPWLAPLRAQPELAEIRRLAEARHRAARETFAAGGGQTLLGLAHGP